MLEHIVWLFVGLVLLVKGADYFVDAGARLAKKLGISDLIVGLTFVAVGTSIPELASSVTAAAEGYTGLITGNIVGSNIANIGLIIGMCALFNTLKTDKKMYKRDGYIFLLSVVLLFGLSLDGIITLYEGLLFLLVYVGYIFFLIKTRESRIKKYEFRDFLDHLFSFRYVSTIKKGVMQQLMNIKNHSTVKEKKQLHLIKQGLVADLLVMVVATIAIVYGAKYLVAEAIWAGGLLSLPENVIGLSLVAVGTSLPELVVSVSAARKGLTGLIIGNVIGSNISNILLIFGISSIITPITISEMSIIYTIPIMAFFSIMLLYGISLDWKIGRKEGGIFVILYALFMIFAFTQGLT